MENCKIFPLRFAISLGHDDSDRDQHSFLEIVTKVTVQAIQAKRKNARHKCDSFQVLGEISTVPASLWLESEERTTSWLFYSSHLCI